MSDKQQEAASTSTATATTKECIHKFTNRLINEKSPYLLKHAHNPVEWMPWGEEAFELARKQDKLIFLSVGYMACHWCNVMEKESFENEDIAKVMNENCVNIKIDREERPDIDKIYMTYLQEISGSGGWPMSIWLTPSLEPVTGGTYFAPEAKYGRPGFPDMVKKLATLWKEDRSMVQERADTFTEYLKEERPKGNIQDALSEGTMDKCYKQIIRSYDPVYGGYSDAPKFPRCSIFNFITTTNKQFGDSEQSLEKLYFTLEKMAYGGMNDQLGGGFHRYSVTPDWKVPHFEKMLYDNAQIPLVYLDAFQLSGNPLFRDTAVATLRYVQNNLTSKVGGFYSAEDADSLNEQNEKSEGAYYIWSYQDITKALNENKEAIDIFSFTFGVIENGNVNPKDDPHHEFTEKNIITQVNTIEQTAAYCKKSVEDIQLSIDQSKLKLLEYREANKVRPQLDDKIIVAWNGLMVSAFCKGYQLTGDKSFLKSAIDSVEFIKLNLYDKDTNSLIRSYKDGPSKIQGFTDDYSFLIQGLLDIYQVTFELSYLQWAIGLQSKQDTLFYDEKDGGYFSTSGLDTSILTRMKEEHDGAEPSCQSISVSNLLKLYSITYKEEYKEKALSTLESSSFYLDKAPVAMPQMVVSLFMYLNSINSIIITTNSSSNENSGKEVDEILKEINSQFIPNKVVIFNDLAKPEIKQFFEKNTSNLNLIHSNTIYDKTVFSLCNGNVGCTIPTNILSQIKSTLSNQIYP